MVQWIHISQRSIKGGGIVVVLSVIGFLLVFTKTSTILGYLFIVASLIIGVMYALFGAAKMYRRIV